MHVLKFITVTGLLSLASAQGKLRILPLGASIAELTCRRSKLWSQLAGAGVTNNIEFVGTKTNNARCCGGSFDLHHEGHAGFTAVDVSNIWLNGWLSADKPDVVQYMLGTNDILQGKPTSAIVAAHTKIIQSFRASNPNIKIILDLLLPLPQNPSKLSEVNNALRTLASKLTTATSPITVEDLNSDFPSNGLSNGIHPNDAGDNFIANKLFPIFLGIIQSSSVNAAGARLKAQVTGTASTIELGSLTMALTGSALPKVSSALSVISSITARNVTSSATTVRVNSTSARSTTSSGTSRTGLASITSSAATSVVTSAVATSTIRSAGTKEVAVANVWSVVVMVMLFWGVMLVV